MIFRNQPQVAVEPPSDLLFEALPAGEWSPSKGREDEITAGWREIAASPERWLLNADGFEYCCDCYPCAPGAATIKWANLKSWLARACPDRRAPKQIRRSCADSGRKSKRPVPAPHRDDKLRSN